MSWKFVKEFKKKFKRNINKSRNILFHIITNSMKRVNLT